MTNIDTVIKSTEHPLINRAVASELNVVDPDSEVGKEILEDNVIQLRSAGNDRKTGLGGN